MEGAMYRLISVLKGAAIGAGAMYFLDPDLGNRRRALVRDQLYHLCNKAGDVADAKFRDMQNRLYGTFAELRSSLHHDRPSDKVLCDRVRSIIGRYISHPGAIEVDACDGIVILGGPIPANELDDLLCAVQSVRGVAGVEDHLDIHQSGEFIPDLQGSGRRTG
jgi:hypothetical protein